MVIITSDDNTHKKLFSGVTGVDANDFEQISHENFKVEKCTECAKNAIKLANDVIFNIEFILFILFSRCLAI